MVDSFATTDDLQARWHPLSTEERQRAQTLLEDASDIIRTQCSGWKQAQPTTLRRVVCAMVKRAMLAESDNPMGYQQISQTTGPFTDMHTYANPNGDLYLTSAEKQSLRPLSTGRAFSFGYARSGDGTD